jgi:DNA-directed RNA polymerase specialized sigma subunit
MHAPADQVRVLLRQRLGREPDEEGVRGAHAMFTQQARQVREQQQRAQEASMAAQRQTDSARDELAAKLGREPTEEELAVQLRQLVRRPPPPPPPYPLYLAMLTRRARG